MRAGEVLDVWLGVRLTFGFSTLPTVLLGISVGVNDEGSLGPDSSASSAILPFFLLAARFGGARRVYLEACERPCPPALGEKCGYVGGGCAACTFRRDDGVEE